MRLGDHVGRVGRLGVLDEVAQFRVFLVADGGLERGGALRDLAHLLHFLRLDAQLGGQIVVVGLFAGLLEQLALGADHLVDLLDHVHRDADVAVLVGDGPGDGLPDPPGGVGGELVALAVVELLHGADETGVALLDEVEQVHVLGVVVLGDGDDQAQVRLDHAVLGPLVAGLDALGQLDLLVLGEQGDLAGFLEVEAQRVVGDGLDGEVESGLGGLEDALADRALLVDLDGLIEELRVEVLDLLHGHVVLFDQRHDLVAGDVAALLADLQEVLDVHDGTNVEGGSVAFSLHCPLLS